MRTRRIIQSISTSAIFTASLALTNDVTRSAQVNLMTSGPSRHHELQVRGGAVDTTSKKKSKSSKKSLSSRNDKKTKDVINEKMKESDAATLMGDAIR